MATKNKTSKHDLYIEEVQKFAAYVDFNEKQIGIYCTAEDCLIAENSHALKSLKNKFHYKIQMVIK